MRSRAGDWVEVRSKEEILRTLDNRGCLENMPFMPEMFACCGKPFRIYKRAHKACDTLTPVVSLTRSLRAGVILDGVRCDGSAHSGCQARCSVFWKEAWLKPLADSDSETFQLEEGRASGSGCTEEDVHRATQADGSSPDRIRYQCQATDFRAYTESMRARHLRQYVEDWRSGNVSLKSMFLTISYHVFRFLGRPKWEAGGGAYAKFYDWFQSLWGGAPYPRRRGMLRDGDEHPVNDLNLRPGELVRVKSYEAILATINGNNMNRGLSFDGEMMPYCGGVFRVRERVEHFIDEKTGYMRTMKTPAIILENVWCLAQFTPYRLFCPRAIHSWWREAWLERAPEATEPSAANALGARKILKPLAERLSPRAPEC